MDVKDILNRRTDLSTFLVHLTREYEGTLARQNLESILQNRLIEARSVYGHLRLRLLQEEIELENQKTVCFTETPLQFTHLMLEEIDNRQFQFGPYGVAITKRIGRRTGVNPVWYVDMTPGHDWITNNLDRLAERFIEGGCVDNDLARLFPFIEQMGSGNVAAGGTYRKEFWWEREWRHIGDYELPDTLICLSPEAETEHFSEILENAGLAGSCIDPRWSLEKIIAYSVGFAIPDIEIIHGN